MSATNRFPRAPEVGRHRDNVTVADGASITEKKWGVNAHGQETAIVEVTLNGDAVDVDVLYWSETAGKFVPDPSGSPVTVTESSSLVASVYGRRFFVKLSNLVNVTRIDVDVASFGRETGE